MRRVGAKGGVVNCPICFDKGLAVLEWTDAPPDFGVCLCDAGQAMRRTENEGRAVTPLWRVWCALHQVDPSRVSMLEDVFTADELTAVGLRKAPANISREAALLAAGRKAKK